MQGAATMLVPPAPPTCWEFFGLSGPTSRHNLELLYQARVNAVTPAGISNAMTAAYIYERYQECLAQIDGW